MFKPNEGLKSSKGEELDFIGANSSKKDNKESMSEIDRLKEENKRLKRTLLERFD